MSAEERDELVRYRPARAHEAIEEANALLEKSLFHGSTNRLYYAMFYATSAALASRDVHPKTHKGARPQFSLLFVNDGSVPEQLSDAYSELFELRHSGDYDDFVSIETDTVMRLHVHAVERIQDIEQLLGK